MGDIRNWMKEMKKLQEVGFENCFMTPAILAEMLDIVGEYLKANPGDDENEVVFSFNQYNTNKFLENDETRKILYDFLNKYEAKHYFKLTCSNEF